MVAGHEKEHMYACIWMVGVFVIFQIDGCEMSSLYQAFHQHLIYRLNITQQVNVVSCQLFTIIHFF